MADYQRSLSEEVDHLLRNAQLRDELEPFYDESISRLNVAEMPVLEENELLASLLAWERAPTRPIAQWFVPELRLPKPSELTDERLHEVLWATIHQLYDQRIVLDFTDHLSDRQLYQLIFRDILPSQEKQIDYRPAGCYLHWDCADAALNPEIWLKHYATEIERKMWAESNYEPLPDREPAPYPRQLPRQPL
ncbi:MAG: hypothetical protein AB7O62_08855 [Pirellulales bacterium]